MQKVFVLGPKTMMNGKNASYKLKYKPILQFSLLCEYNLDISRCLGAFEIEDDQEM